MKEYHEPDVGFQLGPIGDIYAMVYNTQKDKLLEWTDKLEKLHRKILLVNKLWNDDRLNEVHIYTSNEKSFSFVQFVVR